MLTGSCHSGDPTATSPDGAANAARSLDWDPISELREDKRSYAPRRRVGRMTAPDHFAGTVSKALARGDRPHMQGGLFDGWVRSARLRSAQDVAPRHATVAEAAADVAAHVKGFLGRP